MNTVNIVTKDFEWDTTLTLSHYNDRWLTRDPNWKPKPYEKENQFIHLFDVSWTDCFQSASSL